MIINHKDQHNKRYVAGRGFVQLNSRKYIMGKGFVDVLAQKLPSLAWSFATNPDSAIETGMAAMSAIKFGKQVRDTAEEIKRARKAADKIYSLKLMDLIDNANNSAVEGSGFRKI